MTAAMTATDNNNQQSTENTAPEAPVLFQTEATDCGHLIGIMTLNMPKSLNAPALRCVNYYHSSWSNGKVMIR